MVLQQVGECVAQRDVRALQVRSVAYIVVREVVFSSDTGEAQFNSFGEGVGKGTVGLQTGRADRTLVRQIVVIDVIAQ